MTVHTTTKRGRSLVTRANVIVAGAAMLFGMSVSYLAVRNSAPLSAAPDKSNVISKCLLSPSSCGYPDETNTGVPAGVTLTPSGPIVVSPKDPNATVVIDGMDVKGSIVVKRGKAVIRNTRVSNTGDVVNNVAAIRLYDGTSAIVEDSEIDAGDAALAVGYRNYTLTRVDIKGGSDALRADGNVTVTDSYIHDLSRQTASHSDIIQTLSGNDVVIRHNTLMAYKPVPGTCMVEGDPMNAAYQFGNFNGNLNNVLVENNLVNGGNYTFNANWKSVDEGKFTVTNIRIQNNYFGRDFRYGPDAHMDHGVVFEGNKYIDDNSLIQ
jgi:hypothetical protein